MLSSALAFLGTSLTFLSYPLLAVKCASADDLNAWSLETFFDRTMQFIWAMIILLTWAPWYLGFASLVRSASPLSLSLLACLRGALSPPLLLTPPPLPPSPLPPPPFLSACPACAPCWCTLCAAARHCAPRCLPCTLACPQQRCAMA